jgi:ABC-type phosphate transport system substrate-binding protein
MQMMSMNRAVLVLVATVLLGFDTRPQAAADEVAVIVNKSNPINALTMIQLRKIVLAQEAKWPGGGKITVWMTPPGQSERASTLKIVCSMSETDFTLHFMHASFKGDSGDPPKTAGSGAQVRQSIAGAVNGVGFIAASQVDDSVKVVAIDGNRPGEPAYKLKPK